jgi:hypothetical protein
MARRSALTRLPSRTTARPSTRRSRTRLGPARRSAAASQDPAASTPFMSQMARSARYPGAICPSSPPRPSTGAVRHPLQQHGLARLGQEMRRIVRGRAVDAEPDRHARIAHRPHGSDAGAEPAVRAGTMRDAGPGAGEEADLGGIELDAMGVPDIGPGPAQLLGILPRPAAELGRANRPRPRRSRRDGCAASPPSRAPGAPYHASARG